MWSSHRNLLSLSILAPTLALLAPLPAAGEPPPSPPARETIASAFYLFRGYEPGREDHLTLIANYHPLQEPDAEVPVPLLDSLTLYDLHLDTDGDGTEDLTFRFRYHSGEGATGASYTVELLRGPVAAPTSSRLLRHRTTGAERLAVPAPFVRPQPFADDGEYEADAAAFVHPIEIPGCGAGRVFVGPRQESHAAHRGLFRSRGIADPLGSPRAALGAYAGFNVTALALEVPVACLLDRGSGVLGGWTAARQLRGRDLLAAPADGPPHGFVEVSRLGNPRLESLEMTLAGQDAPQPLSRTELPSGLEGAASALPDEVLPTLRRRWDLEALYLRGLPGVNETAPGRDLLRLDLAVPPVPAAKQSNLGLLGGDPAGWPNGRRPGDDVVDIQLRALAGAFCHLEGFELCLPEQAPTGGLPWTDQVWVEAAELAPAFPYLRTPIPTETGAAGEGLVAIAGAGLSGCGCGSPYYICWYYAMTRAGYTPGYCPNAIHSGVFGAIDKAYMTQAEIIEWGGHAGYIKSSGSNSVTVDEFNRGGTCGLLTDQVYTGSSYSGAVRGWVRKPAKVSNPNPTNGAGGVSTTATLKWGSASRADGYEVQVAKDSGFNDLVAGTVSGITWTPSSPLQSGKTYYWKVLGYRGPYGGTKVYSEGGADTWSFTTASPCSGVAAPTIYGSLQDGHPKLTWSGVSGADRYKVYRRYDTITGTFYYAGDTTGTSWVDYGNTAFNGQGTKVYVYYKVKSVNDGPGCSPASESGFSNYQQFTCEELLW